VTGRHRGRRSLMLTFDMSLRPAPAHSPSTVSPNQETGPGRTSIRFPNHHVLLIFPRSVDVHAQPLTNRSRTVGRISSTVVACHGTTSGRKDSSTLRGTWNVESTRRGDAITVGSSWWISCGHAELGSRAKYARWV
jgi:hypothetical protein